MLTHKHIREKRRNRARLVPDLLSRAQRLVAIRQESAHINAYVTPDNSQTYFLFMIVRARRFYSEHAKLYQLLSYM